MSEEQQDAPVQPAVPPAAEAANERGLDKVRVGVVVSAKQDKTIVVNIDRRTAHPLYKKVVTTSKKYYAHDEENQAGEGDVVRIRETRPLSKLKRWRLVEVVRKAED